MAQREMTLICQSCGREFTLPQAEIDAYWEQGMSIPVFCSIKCQINGWNPQAVAFPLTGGGTKGFTLVIRQGNYGFKAVHGQTGRT